MDGEAAAVSPHGDVRGKKTIMEGSGAKPPEENSRRAFRSRKSKPSRTQICHQVVRTCYLAYSSYAPVR